MKNRTSVTLPGLPFGTTMTKRFVATTLGSRATPPATALLIVASSAVMSTSALAPERSFCTSADDAPVSTWTFAPGFACR